MKTLGDHIKKKRLDLKLLQKDVAARLGVHPNTVLDWEKNKTTPALRFIPKIIKFIGYVPEDARPNATFGEKIVTEHAGCSA